jgi:hypothetical protein
MSDRIVALVAKCDRATALAWIGDRQAWLSREGRKWALCDDYTEETITTEGTTIEIAVRRWGKQLGVAVQHIDTDVEY